MASISRDDKSEFQTFITIKKKLIKNNKYYIIDSDDHRHLLTGIHRKEFFDFLKIDNQYPGKFKKKLFGKQFVFDPINYNELPPIHQLDVSSYETSDQPFVYKHTRPTDQSNDHYLSPSNISVIITPSWAVNPVAVNPVTVNPVAVNPVAVNPVAVNPVAVNPVAVDPLNKYTSAPLRSNIYDLFDLHATNDISSEVKLNESRLNPLQLTSLLPSQHRLSKLPSQLHRHRLPLLPLPPLLTPMPSPTLQLPSTISSPSPSPSISSQSPPISPTTSPTHGKHAITDSLVVPVTSSFPLDVVIKTR